MIAFCNAFRKKHTPPNNAPSTLLRAGGFGSQSRPKTKRCRGGSLTFFNGFHFGFLLLYPSLQGIGCCLHVSFAASTVHPLMDVTVALVAQ